MNKYFSIIKDSRNQVKTGKKKVDEIAHDSYVLIAVGNILQYYNTIPAIELEDFIYLCNDVYTYSEEGMVLISDRAYDEVMNYWISEGNERIIYPDSIKSASTWELIKHEDPGTVGSLKKTYDKYEFLSYLTGKPIKELSNGLIADTLYEEYIISPKYDGISASIKVKNGKIEYAATRRDGDYGQNITDCILSYKYSLEDINKRFLKECKSLGMELNNETLDNGFYKVEILMSRSKFNLLLSETKARYANRRSAVSGICNTPKNIEYGKYLTIMPLLFKPENENRVIYAPEHSNRLINFDPENIFHYMNNLLKSIRHPEFEYRVDGIVCFPNSMGDLNMFDYMDNAMAFKVNTAKAISPIEYAYISIGNRGKAIPMIHVTPVEVNETVVQDVSLGSWDKFLSMNLHEGESVKIFSAGDVIPQAVPLNPKRYEKGSKKIKLPRVCPYCGEDLERKKNEYWCTNSECPKIQCGEIVNFIEKINGKNIGEGVIEGLYEKGLVKSIQDLFENTVDRLKNSDIDGWGEISIRNLENELHRLMREPIQVSTFIGAIGITGIAKKKCRKIFNHYDLDWILKHDPFEVKMMLCGISGIGSTTAEIFVSEIREKREELKKLSNLFDITEDKKYKGSVVFTGFRDRDIEEKFEDIGYEVTDTITSDTVLLVNGSRDTNSKKYKEALKRGISIIGRQEIDNTISQMDVITDEWVLEDEERSR